jgi:hypothetical protein
MSARITAEELAALKTPLMLAKHRMDTCAATEEDED